jgi:L-lactate dehydrogenase complex protein LldG
LDVSSSVTRTFEERVKAHTATCSRTTIEEFDAALRTQLEEPAIGTPLPIDGVSLENHPISTSPTPRELEAARTGVTAVEFAIAEYGSVVVTSGPEGTEQISLFPDTHVAVLRERDILEGMPEAFERLAEDVSEGLTSAVLATGPSATADMGELVYGAHGPRNVHVLVLTDR